MDSFIFRIKLNIIPISVHGIYYLVKSER